MTEPQQTMEDFIQTYLTPLLARFRDTFQMKDNFTDEEIIGQWISKYFKWDSDKVFNACYAAFVDINYEDFADDIKKLWQTPIPTKKTKSQQKYEALKLKYKDSVIAYRAELMKMCLNDFIAEIDVIFYKKDKELLIEQDNDLSYANFLSGFLKLEL